MSNSQVLKQIYRRDDAIQEYWDNPNCETWLALTDAEDAMRAAQQVVQPDPLPNGAPYCPWCGSRHWSTNCQD